MNEKIQWMETLLEWPTFSSIKVKRRWLNQFGLKKKKSSFFCVTRFWSFSQFWNNSFSVSKTQFCKNSSLIPTNCYFLCQNHSWSWTAFVKPGRVLLVLKKGVKVSYLGIQVDPIVFGSFFTKCVKISTFLW